MKIFFGSTFIEDEKLKEGGINHPIKLEYFKIINEDQITKMEKEKFGIKVVKTQYINNDINVEDEMVQYISNDERKIDEVLTLFKKNEVTPINMQEVIIDLSKKSLFM